MKKLIFLLCLFFLSCNDNTTNINPVTPHKEITVLQFNWGLELTVELKNTGQVTIDNINLKFLYKTINGPLYRFDSLFTTWNDTIHINEIQQKTFNLNLPPGFTIQAAQLFLYY